MEKTKNRRGPGLGRPRRRPAPLLDATLVIRRRLLFDGLQTVILPMKLRVFAPHSKNRNTSWY